MDADETCLSYAELDARANRLARHLLQLGAGPGDRIALLFDHAVPAYTAMLAVLKIHAAYVPLDPGFPSDRIAYIVEDAEVSRVLTLVSLEAIISDVTVPHLCLDREQARIDGQDASRVQLEQRTEGREDLAYIIYTSGSTGRPKGVAIEHASICNFVRVASEVYGIRPHHRVYQGMTIAFDFSVEEIWVPWIAGATLVPKPRGTALLGAELAEFLAENRVTAMCCVPTLLSTIEDDLPDLSFLLVSGEACPRDLIVRWHRPGRRFLNVYGPTEATVTATMAVAHPDRPVTLGEPLPTYSAVILDPDEARVLPNGELGEIGLAGVGLAKEYVNRDDLTAKAFIPDFIGLPDNPSGRIYRTGDLGRFNEDGDIEYHGRIDTQVKVRGYRIELSEIESVLLRVPGIAQAVVNTFEPEPGLVELVGYYTVRQDGENLHDQEIRERLRERLPGYMVPAYFERLDRIPTLPSDKADRKNLPAPRGKRTTVGDEEYVAPSSRTEHVLAEALAAVLRLEKVSVAANFFTDLGANSMLMAQFAGRLRKDARVPVPAMRDLYTAPTVSALAETLEAVPVQASAEIQPGRTLRPEPLGAAQHILCGTLQAMVFVLTTFVASLVLLEGYLFASNGQGLLDVLWRAFVFGTLSFVGWSLFPIAAKWLLIGRWTVQEFPVWSLAYFRFWLVKNIIRATPMRMFIGTPIYPLYLRALGAKIGRRTAIFSRFVPVCTDLLTIGDDAVVRKDALISCYRAHDGTIQTGTVHLGRDALVGEGSVLDIHTAIGDGGQLGHASSLHALQSVPSGQQWHGSPAQATDTDFRTVAPTDCGLRRRVVYSAIAILYRLVLTPGLGLGVLALLIPFYVGLEHLNHGSPWFYVDLLALTLLLLLLGLPLAVVGLAVIPRVLNLCLTPGRVYPLYSWRYAVQRAIDRMTNVQFFMRLTGDSSLIVHYVRLLGYKQPDLVQTGSNFGLATKQDNPYLVTTGSGTMVADGLAIMNADFSGSSFMVSPVSIGARSFMGNNIYYPSTATTGDNCLYATKVMVPVDGPPREGTGLLGSPAFKIPRTVRRDVDFRAQASGPELQALLRAKNRHNAVTIMCFLLRSWIYASAGLLFASYAIALHSIYDVFAVTAAFLGMQLFSVSYFVLVERASLGFRRLQPLFCSIYEEPFWRTERFWKLSARAYLEAFNGTPFKPLIWRLLGVRMGRRVLDDGCYIPERTLVSVGDDCTLNVLSIVQCHSMEDGAFKVEGTTVGARCTLGANSFVHYGAVIGDGALVEADSFVMKGTEIPPTSTFGGNPAREFTARPPLVPVRSGRHAARTPTGSRRVRVVARRRQGRHELSGRRTEQGPASGGWE
ncbi:Pls/PosA family non-ribosomal peptide synthetase [Kocuria rosea]|uniref:Pls/PosA family non-ribosomal peptide synthetase n=1 Tax=Kocuria rosea TaxID=1275 RepID=UPI00254263CC|nr:Pls/PosA family non-ribosomal peptide synthetase [Kocuria rosea]WIG16258.1 amino acid adenylation domain-containing protein [Kocuria rosea]